MNQGYRGGYAQDASPQGYGGGQGIHSVLYLLNKFKENIVFISYSKGYGNPERVPPPGVAPAGNGLGVPGAGAGAAGPGGPGPQRGGGHHHQPSQSQYHPYRRGGV